MKPETTAETTSDSPLLNVPGEVRNMIYEEVVGFDEHIVLRRDETCIREPALLATCRQIRSEALSTFWCSNVFQAFGSAPIQTIITQFAAKKMRSNTALHINPVGFSSSTDSYSASVCNALTNRVRQESIIGTKEGHECARRIFKEQNGGWKYFWENMFARCGVTEDVRDSVLLPFEITESGHTKTDWTNINGFKDYDVMLEGDKYVIRHKT